MFKGQEGITLVALVITIIVLLILAGVTLSLLFNEDSGILKYATEGGQNYTNAAAEEQAMLNTFEQVVENVVNRVTTPATPASPSV